MNENPQRGGGDLVLAPGAFAHVQDTTKGVITVLVGPIKSSLSQTDQPVVWDPMTNRFKQVSTEAAVQAFAYAPEGHYMILQNPADENAHPREGGSSNGLPTLKFGRQINIPGPAIFPLWPQQVAKVIIGHTLRSNQYLVVRIINEEAAKANWNTAVMKLQTSAPAAASLPTVPPVPPPPMLAGEEIRSSAAPIIVKSSAPEGGTAEDVAPHTSLRNLDVSKLTLGTLLNIRGNEVAFYIPPTGVEVVPDPTTGEYVRDALTLERLEYCILLGQDGEKRYLRGPAVVFPEPTESFVDRVETNGETKTKFKAIQLNAISGIYVQVIADYVDEKGRERLIGEELFITGGEGGQQIYYPRPEHAIVKYGDKKIHYATAVPAGEGRYMLDRLTGEVETITGPRMLLPDPRRQVLVKRILTRAQVELWFPGNETAKAYNKGLEDERLSKGITADYLAEEPSAQYRGRVSEMSLSATRSAGASAFGDELTRKESFTPPRTITLDTKYDGAVSLDVFVGYAILVTSKTGTRRVVVGPETVLLDYDETLMTMELSTGKPKNTDKVLRDVYLRVTNNKVSDIVNVVTADMVPVKLSLSYRVNFIGEDHEKWFAVENYVKFLCDHNRSLLKAKVRQVGIENFNAGSTEIIRDIILGTKTTDPTGKRPNQVFKENNCEVSDVEVLGVEILDDEVRRQLAQAQQATLTTQLRLTGAEREFKATKQLESIKRDTLDELDETAEKQAELEADKQGRELINALQRLNATAEQEATRLKNQTAYLQAEQAAELARQEGVNLVAEADRKRETLRFEMEQEQLKAENEEKMRLITAEVAAMVEKAKAVTPELIAAMQAFGDKDLAAKAVQAMAPMSILGGASLADVVSKLFGETQLGTTINKALSGPLGRRELTGAAATH